MMIRVKSINKAIIITCNPIVPARFKYKLLEDLEKQYHLKTSVQGFLGHFEKAKVTEEEKLEYLKCYEENDFEYSFEEFLELATFPVRDLKVLSKEKEIAFIDFMPDGDVDSIWIDVYDKKSQKDLTELVKRLAGNIS